MTKKYFYICIDFSQVSADENLSNLVKEEITNKVDEAVANAQAAIDKIRISSLEQRENLGKMKDSAKNAIASAQEEINKAVEKVKELGEKADLEQYKKDIKNAVQKAVNTAQNQINNVLLNLKKQGISAITLKYVEKAGLDALSAAKVGINNSTSLVESSFKDLKSKLKELLNNAKN